MMLPVNSPCVLTGIVKRITPNEKDGKTSHVVVIEYLVERGQDQTVEAYREFWCSDYYKSTCGQITPGAKVSISFNPGSREYNGKSYAKDDVRTIKILEPGPPAASAGPPPSDKLDYTPRPHPQPEQDPLF